MVILLSITRYDFYLLLGFIDIKVPLHKFAKVPERNQFCSISGIFLYAFSITVSIIFIGHTCLNRRHVLFLSSKSDIYWREQ